MTDLARAADVVLPGASLDARRTRAYVNQQGRLQAAARALAAPGDAQEDWQIFVNLGDGARRDAGLHQQRARARRRGAGAGRQRRPTPAWPSSRSPGRSRRKQLAAGVQSVRALEVGRHVPGPAAGEVRRAARSRRRFPVQRSGCRRSIGATAPMNQNVTLLAAFAAGFLSFVSPCVLPLIPATSRSSRACRWRKCAATRRARRPRALQVFLTSLAFVIGFSIVFVALGASATAIGKFLFARLPLLSKIAGVILIVVRPAHDGRVPAGVPRNREARAGAAQAGRAARRDAGRHRLRVRLDAVHRPDPRRDPGDRRIEEQRSGKGSRCWRSTRSGLGIPFLITSLAINQFFGCCEDDPPLLPRHRGRPRARCWSRSAC